MPLDRLNNSKFMSDKGQAQRSAREQLKFIIANKDKLMRIINGKNLIISAESLNNYQDNFTPKQLSFIDSIYEKTMKGFGFESYQTTYRPK